MSLDPDMCPGDSSGVNAGGEHCTATYSSVVLPYRHNDRNTEEHEEEYDPSTGKTECAHCGVSMD
jgi:hypothetical protein